MGRTRYKIYDKEAAHFLTATIVNWIPLFSNPDHAQIILDALRYLVEQKSNTSIKIPSAVAMSMNRRTGDIRAHGTMRASLDWCR